MGSYAYCWLDRWRVSWSKGNVDAFLTLLFRETDKRVADSDAPDLLWVIRNYWNDSSDSPDDDRSFVFYEAAVNVVRDRLALLGYTSETARAVFEKGRVARIHWLKERAPRPTNESLNPYWLTEIAELEDLTVESWQRSILQELGEGSNGPPGAWRIVDELRGFPAYDSLAQLRLALDAVPKAKHLIYDVSDLVWSGYYAPDDAIIEGEISSASSDFEHQSRTIVLTEGSSDAWILEGALRNLYPHMADYFSFMRFEESRVPGGAGHLANLLRAFVGARVANRVIALFDNDTAARDAMRGLQPLQLPERFRVLALPPVELLENCPTLGPTGPASMDVNGLAAGIELYLGRDVLRMADCALAPIQWTGYVSGMRQYQGEVIDKRRIQEAFCAKLTATSKPPAEDDGDWSELRSVLRLLFSAFHELDREEILAQIEGPEDDDAGEPEAGGDGDETGES